MNCDQVFDVLTRGPFPTGTACDMPVEAHFRVCPECRQLAEALRPALELFQEAISPEESQDLPGYWCAVATDRAQPVVSYARELEPIRRHVPSEPAAPTIFRAVGLGAGRRTGAGSHARIAGQLAMVAGRLFDRPARYGRQAGSDRRRRVAPLQYGRPQDAGGPAGRLHRSRAQPGTALLGDQPAAVGQRQSRQFALLHRVSQRQLRLGVDVRHDHGQPELPDLPQWQDVRCLRIAENSANLPCAAGAFPGRGQPQFARPSIYSRHGVGETGDLRQAGCRGVAPMFCRNQPIHVRRTGSCDHEEMYRSRNAGCRGDCRAVSGRCCAGR